MEPCALSKASHILVHNSFGQIEIVSTQVKQFQASNAEKEKELLAIFPQYVHSNSIRVMDYRCNRFILNPSTGYFVPIENLLVECMPHADTDYFEGLSGARAEWIAQFLGLNEILIEERSGWQIFYNELLNPFYVFQVVSFFIWIFEDYYMYAVVILIMATSSAILTVIEAKRNLDKMRQMARYVCQIRAKRNGEIMALLSTSLVPGDVLILDDSCMDVIPCDGVLLSGDAIVDESMLTGETVPVSKAALSITSDIDLVNIPGSKHALYSGTKLLRCRAHHGRPAMMLVTRTGFLTAKGSLVQSIMFPRPNNFRFYRDSMLFIGILAVIAAVGFSMALINFIVMGVATYWIVCRALDVITVVVPPALPATMAIGTVFAIKRLERRQIFCISPPRINIASKVQTMCFDKTGTLTEEGLKIHRVLPVHSCSKRDPKNLLDLPVETLTKKHNPAFGSPVSNVQELGNLQHEMVRLMATCHGLRKINGKLMGDSLDLRMFEFTGWEIEELNDVGETIVPTIVRPPGSPAFSLQNESQVDTLGGDRGYTVPLNEMGIIRQFDFDSKIRRMSVVTRSLTEDFLYIFTKGSPESLFEICCRDSLPNDYSNVFSHYAHHGFRVIGCAYKPCPGLTWLKAQKFSRSDAESDLIFLGFIVFENRLKPQTISTVRTLRSAKINNIMATGDNILTAISVGRASGLIPEDALVFHPVSFINARSSRDVIWKCVDDVDLLFDSVRLKPIEPQTDSENAPYICTRKKHYVLAISGDFFEWMHERLVGREEYVKLILIHCLIYARMSPLQKQLLVENLQQRSFIVGFCGDGANDCGALKAADVGISLSQAEASIAAPFTSKFQDISCIPIVLREGRASLVTSFCCFKYMTLYSMIQFTTLIFLYTYNSTLADGQFVYVDLLLIVPLGILMSRYAPADDLVPLQPTAKLISAPMLSSILGHIIIQAVAQTFFYIFFARPLKESWISPIDDESNTLHPSTSTMFLFSAFLYILTALLFSSGRPFRQRLYWPFVIYSIISLLVTLLITLKRISWIDDWLYLVDVPFHSRLSVILASLLYAIAAFVYDRVISPRIAHHIQYCYHQGISNT